MVLVREKCHLVQIIKDGDAEIVVYKQWIKTRQHWNYVAEERWLIEIQIEKEIQTGHFGGLFYCLKKGNPMPVHQIRTPPEPPSPPPPRWVYDDDRLAKKKRKERRDNPCQ